MQFLQAVEFSDKTESSGSFIIKTREIKNLFFQGQIIWLKILICKKEKTKRRSEVGNLRRIKNGDLFQETFSSLKMFLKIKPSRMLLN